jgi:serine protease AprX
MVFRTNLVVGTLLLSAHAALAAPGGAHRARLSADLQDHLNVGSQAIEVIVEGDAADVDALAARYNVRVSKRIASGAVLTVNAGQLAAIQQDEAVDHLSGNVRIQSSDAVTAESTGVDQVWAGSEAVKGLTGAGITVAVIDSGIDTTHAAMRGRVIATKDFLGGDGRDLYGHGTHIAGIIAGQSVSTPDGKDYRGIAFGAYLVNLRVLDEHGGGSVADVVDAIDWAVAHRKEFNIRVINLSLGAPVLQPYRDDPLCEAVERAVKKGLVVVAAAGNYGKNAQGQTVLGSITSPANSPYAIAVGAIDTQGTPQRSDDTVASWSSRGPTAYDLLLKPDLAAPGVRIASAQAAGAYLPTTYPARHVTGDGASAYFQLSGTSQSAAVVSGAAALLLDGSSNLRPTDVKAVVEFSSSLMTHDGVIGAGAGSVNVLAAIELIRDGELSTLRIASESAIPSGVLVLLAPAADSVRNQSIVWGVNGNSIVWGVNSSSIVWGVNGNSIVWGVNSSSIVWGVNDNSIVWGVNGSSIVLGVNASSIVWGVNDASIVWEVGDGVSAGTAEPVA